MGGSRREKTGLFLYPKIHERSSPLSATHEMRGRVFGRLGPHTVKIVLLYVNIGKGNCSKSVGFLLMSIDVSQKGRLLFAQSEFTDRFYQKM